MHVTDPDTIDHISKLVEDGRPYVGVFVQKDDMQEMHRYGSEDEEGSVVAASDLHEIGTFAQVHQIVPSLNKGAQVLVMGHRRMRRGEVLNKGPPLIVAADHLDTPEYDAQDEMIRATMNEIITTMRDILRTNPMYKDHVDSYVNRINEFREPQVSLQTLRPI